MLNKSAHMNYQVTLDVLKRNFDYVIQFGSNKAVPIDVMKKDRRIAVILAGQSVNEFLDFIDKLELQHQVDRAQLKEIKKQLDMAQLRDRMVDSSE